MRPSGGLGGVGPCARSPEGHGSFSFTAWKVIPCRQTSKSTSIWDAACRKASSSALQPKVHHTLLLLANMPMPAAPDTWPGSDGRIRQRLAEAKLRPTQVQQRRVIQALDEAHCAVWQQPVHPDKSASSSLDPKERPPTWPLHAPSFCTHLLFPLPGLSPPLPVHSSTTLIL